MTFLLPPKRSNSLSLLINSFSCPRGRSVFSKAHPVSIATSNQAFITSNLNGPLSPRLLRITLDLPTPLFARPLYALPDPRPRCLPPRIHPPSSPLLTAFSKQARPVPQPLGTLAQPPSHNILLCATNVILFLSLRLRCMFVGVWCVSCIMAAAQEELVYTQVHPWRASSVLVPPLSPYTSKHRYRLGSGAYL